jgi:hypothetical protein
MISPLAQRRRCVYSVPRRSFAALFASNANPLASDGGNIPMAIESAEETVIGKRFVEEILKRLATEYKIAATESKWRDDYPGPYISTFVFNVSNTNQTGSIEFRLKDLEDCRNPSNKSVRTALEKQIRDALQALRQRLG